jgi:site-specific recombinase XerC
LSVPALNRAACGASIVSVDYHLAPEGHHTRAIQELLGHRSITSTAVYTALAPNRFKDFWRGQVYDRAGRLLPLG